MFLRLSPAYPFLVLAGLTACSPPDPARLQQIQQANIQLTKSLHTCLNQRDWNNLDTLFAATVRYRGASLGEGEMEIPRTQFLTHYRRVLHATQPGQFTLRQVYAAGAYHVIVEGISTYALPARPAEPICLIYTIENSHISRVYAY